MSGADVLANRTRGTHHSPFRGRAARAAPWPVTVLPRGPGGQELGDGGEDFAAAALHAESVPVLHPLPVRFTERRVQVKLAREVLVYPSSNRSRLEEGTPPSPARLKPLPRARQRLLTASARRAFESARHVDWRPPPPDSPRYGNSPAMRADRRGAARLPGLQGRGGVVERAVDCCAYLAGRCPKRGGRVRFRAGAVDLRLPEETDIYGILKVLALVEPVRDRQPLPASDDDASFQIVLTPVPERAAQAGWHNARVLGPADLPARIS